VASGVVLVFRPPGLTLAAQHTSLHTDAQAAAPAAPANFDHFDFSTLWLAVHPQPSLPIHGQAAYLIDVDARVVLWQRDPETSRAPASLTKLMTAMVAADDAGSLDRVVTGPRHGGQELGGVDRGGLRRDEVPRPAPDGKEEGDDDRDGGGRRCGFAGPRGNRP